MKKLIACVVTLTLLSACAGREAKTINVVQNNDFSRSCNELKLESQTNHTQIKSLIAANSKKQGANVAKAVVGAVIFLPALFFLDLKGADKAEYEALIQRNLHLSNIGKSKGCALQTKDIAQYKKEIIEERKQKLKKSNN